MGGPGRNEYGISLTLRNGVANHAILLEQARPQVAVEVDRLVVDGVVVRLQLVTLLDGHLVQEVSDLVGIPWVVDVPEGPHHHPLPPHSLLGGQVATCLINRPQPLFEEVVLVAVLWDSHVDYQVDSITHVHVEIGRAALWIERAAVGDVHFRTKIWTDTEVWDVTSQVVATLTSCVVSHWQPFHEVFKAPWKVLGKVIFRRPVLQL